MGQSPDPKLDSYTALNALRLIKEADMMAMSAQAQQPTSSPSILAETLAPPAPPQGLAGMMPMGAPAGQMPQGMAPRGQMPQGMPPQQAPVMQASGGLAGMPISEENYAAGGIVAFSEPTAANNYSLVSDPEANAVTDDPLSRLGASDEVKDADLESPMFTSKGDPETYSKLAAIYPQVVESLGNLKDTEISPATLRKISADEIAAYRAALGPNTAEESQLADIKTRKGELSRSLEEGKGVALLKAAMAVTQGNNWVRAFAGAGAAFGDEYSRAAQADKAEKRSIALAEFNLADAKRKENLGLFKEGRAAQDRYVAAVKAADKAKLDKAKAYADAVKGGMVATKPLRAAGSGAGPKWQEQVLQSNIDYLKTTQKPKQGETPEAFDARIRKMASDTTAAQLKTSFSTSESGPGKLNAALAPVQANIDTRVAEGLAKFKQLNGPYRRAVRAKADVEAQRLLDAEAASLRSIFERSESATGGSTAPKTTTRIQFDKDGNQIK